MPLRSLIFLAISLVIVSGSAVPAGGGYDDNYASEWADTTYTHDAAGRVTKTVDPAGGETRTAYDDAGRVVSSQRPGRPSSLNSYNADGLLVSSTAPGGGVTTYTYTPAGFVASVTDPKGNTPGATPADHRMTSTYDVEGNLLEVTDQLGNTTSNTYDNLSRLISETNELNKTTTYTYDAADNLTKVTSPPATGASGRAETEYTYNVHGELSRRTDALGRETVYTLDPNTGRTTAITDPLSGTKTFTYNAAGRVTGWTNPNGSTVEQEFTPGGMTASQTPSTGMGSRREYNRAGLLTRIADLNDAQETTFTYNNRGFLTRADGSDGVFEYSYTADGNIASRTYPDGTVTEYGYDDDGQPVTQEITKGSSAKTVTYEYDPAGMLAQTTYPTSTGGAGSAMSQSRIYDNAGRITEVTNTGVGVGAQGSLSTTYTRDNAGQPVLVTERRGTGPSATARHTGYAYTGQGWVARECDYGATTPTSACSASTTPRITYGYDDVGNQTAVTKTSPTGTTAETLVSTYDNADQLINTTTTLGTGSPTTKTYTYNANGQLTTGGRTYDALGRITGKKNPGGTGQITYTYNPAGQRTKMTRSGANSGTQTLTWDTNNALPMIAHTENAGATMGAGLGEQTHLWTPDGLPLATYQDTSSPWWYTHDALGSITDITTDTGTALTSMSYTLFGEQTLIDNQTTPTTVPINPGFGYTAGFNQLGDPEVHLRARDYDPTLRMFSTPDPLNPDNSAAAFTTYRYANNSPLVYIDPTGEWGIDINGAWHALKNAGSSVVNTASNVGIGIWENTTNHVPACAAHDKSACGGLFLDITTFGTAETAAADLSGCADRDLASCGWLWVDIVTLGTAGGGATRTVCMQVKNVKGMPRVRGERGSVRLPGGRRADAAKSGAAGADNVVNGARLRAQLAGKEIAGGHAFEKHILDLGEFPGIRTRAQFASHIEDVVMNGQMRNLGGGRTGFWRDGTVVIRNPRASDGGTAFQPQDGYDYFLNQLH